MEGPPVALFDSLKVRTARTECLLCLPSRSPGCGISSNAPRALAGSFCFAGEHVLAALVALLA